MNFKGLVWGALIAPVIKFMKWVFCLVFSLIIATASAQKKSVNPSPKSITGIEGVSKVLMEHYNPNSDSLNKQCLEACVFIKFKITANGKFAGIAYTQNTPVFICQALNRAFEEITPLLALTNFKVINKDTYLLPFYYNYNYACGFEYGAFDTEKKITPDEEVKYKQKQLSMNHFAESIEQITSFTDGTKGKLRCIVLNPVIVGPVMY